MRLRIRPDANPWYLTHLIRSLPMKEYFSLHSVGSTMDNLSATTVAEAPIAVPPRTEQNDISRVVGRVVATIVKATENLTVQLALLAEYREALITAAVTGEIDVDTFDGKRVVERTAS